MKKRGKPMRGKRKMVKRKGRGMKTMRGQKRAERHFLTGGTQF